MHESVLMHADIHERAKVYNVAHRAFYYHSDLKVVNAHYVFS